jgi:uncharacterized protein (DUF362 family)
MKESTVYVYKTSPKTLEMDIEKVLNTSDFQELNPRKETLIKINANYDRDWPGCNTSRWFLDALLKNLRKRGFDSLRVIEGDLKLQPAVKTINAIGIDKILEKYEVPFLPIENLPRENELTMILKNSQLISTPVLHTHTFAVISVAAKNLYGLLPIYREKYHNTLSEKLLELVKDVKVFTLVDGTVGLEGGSMRMGNPVKTDLILTGGNPIAIDVIAAKIMGFSIEKVPYLKLARERGMINNIEIEGDFSEDNLPQYNFEFGNSRLSNLDLWLRGNRITGRLFGYGSLFDRLGNHARRIYTGYVYHKKKEKVLNGDWKEYEEKFSSKRISGK